MFFNIIVVCYVICASIRSRPWILSWSLWLRRGIWCWSWSIISIWSESLRPRSRRVLIISRWPYTTSTWTNVTTWRRIELLPIISCGLSFFFKFGRAVDEILDMSCFWSNLSTFINSVLSVVERRKLAEKHASRHLNFSDTAGTTVFKDELNDAQSFVKSFPFICWCFKFKH